MAVWYWLRGRGSPSERWSLGLLLRGRTASFWTFDEIFRIYEWLKTKYNEPE